MKDLYAQYGCGLCAPEEWLNFDVSPTLRLQRIPLIGRMLSDRLNTRFPKNVRYGDIVGGLPLPAQSCKGIYCSHVLEHLALADLRRTLANTRFLLQPGGIFRLVTPDLEVMAEDYLKRTKQGQPDAAMDFIEETGFGQEERSRSLRALAEFMYGNARHFWLWDKAAMKAELESAGFTGIREAEFNDCRDPHFRFVEEKHRFHRAFCLEATIPDKDSRKREAMSGSDATLASDSGNVPSPTKPATERQWLHIVPYATFGGTEKDCLHVIQATPGDTHRVWVLDRAGPMCAQWESAGAEVVILDVLRNGSRPFYRRVSSLIGDAAMTGIFYWSTIRLPLLRFALRRCPVRLAVHVGNPASQAKMTVFRNRLLHHIFASPIPTRLFACSHHVKNSIGFNAYLSGFPVSVSLNPVAIPDQMPAIMPPGNAEVPVSLGMVARMDPIKDHLTVIRAFARVIEHWPDISLELVGDGPLRAELETSVRDLGIEKQVAFLGMQEDVYAIIRKWRLFLYGTTPREGLGNAVSEALANGLPVVASDLPMIREIDGGSGAVLFCKPGDPDDMAKKIIGLLRDEQLRERMSVTGFHRASEAFDAKRYADDRVRYLIHG